MEEKLAAIKLITGEEIICNVLKLSADSTVLHIKDAYTLSVEYSRRGSAKFSLLPWFFLATSNEIELSVANIVTMCRLEDEEIKENYLEILHANTKSLPPAATAKDELGYLGSVKAYKVVLEKLFNDSDAERPSDL